MADQKKISEALSEAKLAVLERLKIEATDHPASALQLAEAYAWLMSQHQPHGAGSSPATPAG